MKKILLAALLAVSTYASAGAFIGFEGEYENINGSSVNNYSGSVIPGYTFDNGVKLDVKLQGAQDSNTVTSLAIEPRVSYGIKLDDKWVVGLRGSIGEKYQNAGNYAFYTIEPYTSYTVNQDLAIKASVKLKDALGYRDLQTETVYLGPVYKLSESSEVSAKAYHRFDSISSNGLEANYSLYF